ncbi:MAG: hypothetical protein V4484_05590 [Pseudomonadota bacterium]
MFALPTCCFAGTSAPFDIGGLLIWVGGYLLGLIVLVIGAVRSKGCRFALPVYIVAPAAWIAFELNATSRHNAEVYAEYRVGETKNEQAFSLFCKDRQRKVFATAPLESASRQGDRTVYVRFESQFTAKQIYFNAGAVAEYLQKNPTRCARTGLLALEGNYEVYDREKKGFTPEIRRYDACAKGEGEIVPAVKARYELVLGETGQNYPAPFGFGGAWLSRTSVRVVDRNDASTLAKDTLYFLSHDSGVGGCPKAEEQLAELLTDVFGQSER